MVELTEEQISRDFHNGLISGFQISEEMGYFVVTCNGRNEQVLLVDTRYKKPRAFVTLKGVISSLRRIGFDASVLKGK